MWLLASLVSLVCVYAAVREAEACSGFRHLDNGRTFFRYGGLLVTFRCRPGYHLHGYKTNSCVSGHWSRDPPVCVGSGCSSPGPLTNGTSSVNEDGSWVVFSCDSGFQLRGPSMLFCRGHGWNGTKPQCKEFDMMSSSVSVSLQKPIIHQNFQEATLSKENQNQSSFYEAVSDRVSEAADPMSAQVSNHERSRVANVPLHQKTRPTTTLAPISPHHSLKSHQGETGPRSWESSTHRSSSSSTGSAPVPSSSSVSSTSPSTRSTEPSITTQPDVTVLLKTSNTPEHHLTVNTTPDPPPSPLLLGRHPQCPYPPAPAHGTFYLGNVENPGPGDHAGYIEYACSPGFMLAHGDVRRYCLKDGSWSGAAPVCLELTPCSLGNGGCSQLCSHTHHYNHSSNQTDTRTRCHCRPGFTLLNDEKTCRDVDECVELQPQCQHRCFNTFGSFKCGCAAGYQPAGDPASCTDVDECLLPVALTGCVFGCVNTPGSFYCQCPAGYSLQSADSHCQDIDECAVNQGMGPCMERCHNSPGSYRCSCAYGHILAGDGHSCVAQCPPGYRKQPALPPENSTALKEDCADINECQEDTCEWQCVNLPGSHRCICPRGFTLHSDGRRCKDINECAQKNGGCSHLCVNQKGAYKCACPASHRLASYSWKKCIPRTDGRRPA